MTRAGDEDNGPGHSEAVSVEHDGHVAVITLTRPESRGSLDLATASALRAAFARVAEDGTSRAVVLQGAAPDFCSGADIEQLVGRLDEEEVAEELFEALMAPAVCPLPVVVAATGAALGGGLGLFLAGDVRLAVPDARLGAPCGDHGFFALLSVAALSAELGHARAVRILLRDEIVTAETAEAWGLISEIVPRGRIRLVAGEIAAQLAEKSPVTIRETKRIMNQVRYAQVSDELAAILRVMVSPQARRGRERFLDRGR
jgi:enoyl-CoA hydratase/carnithine racemase